MHDHSPPSSSTTAFLKAFLADREADAVVTASRDVRVATAAARSRSRRALASSSRSMLISLFFGCLLLFPHSLLIKLAIYSTVLANAASAEAEDVHLKTQLLDELLVGRLWTLLGCLGRLSVRHGDQ